MDVAEAIEEYLAATQPHLGARTHENYAHHLRAFSAWLASREKKVTLELLNDRVIGEFADHVRKTHRSSVPGKAFSTHTLASYIRTIKIFLRWCLEDDIYGEVLKESQIRKIKLPRQEKFIKEVFTDEQLSKMRKACDREMSDHLKMRAQCILELLCCTGIRAAELCTLTIQDVHLDPAKGYIKVHGKGNKWREVPLINLGHQYKYGDHPAIDHKVRRLLQQYKNRYRADAAGDAPFFISRIQAEPLGIAGLEQILNRLQYQAEIDEISCNPHRFRHTFASRFMQVIGDIYLLSKILGHSKVAVTEEYLKSISGTQVRLSVLRRMHG